MNLFFSLSPLNDASQNGNYFMNGEGKRRATLRHELCENNFFLRK